MTDVYWKTRSRLVTIPSDPQPEKDPGLIDVNAETLGDKDIVEQTRKIVKSRTHLIQKKPGDR